MRNILFVLLVMVATTVGLLATFFSYRNTMTKKVEGYYQSHAQQWVDSLATDELIRQSLTIYFDLDNKKILESFRPGGIFIFSNNIPIKENRQDVQQLKNKLTKINQFYIAKKLPPPLYSIDQEHGKVKRLLEDVTLFPSALAVGEATKQEDNTYLATLMGFYTCLDLKRYGIQWNFAPVADLQLHANSAVVGTRSFSHDANRAAKNIRAYLEGLHNARCLDTLKHFPGHGDTAQDSHKVLPVVDKSWNQLQKQDLFPFYYNIQQKTDPPSAIMTTHILFPQQDKFPATVSSFWLTKVLRHQWNYQGIIVTDDMGMKGIQAVEEKPYPQYPLEVQAFLAGADMLLLFNQVSEEKLHNIIESMHQALDNGDLTIERLRASVKRTILARLKMGVLDDYLAHYVKEMTNSQKQAEVELLLRHSHSLNEQIAKLELRLPMARKTNAVIARYGVRNLSASKQLPALDDFLFFTDANALQQEQILLSDFLPKKNNIQSLAAFPPASHLQTPVVVFHTGNKKLLPLLKKLKSQKRNWQLILYSNLDPFPQKNIIDNLNPTDIFINSLSNSPSSTQALLDWLIKKELPPQPSFPYIRVK